jgi:hypothetical protein
MASEACITSLALCDELWCVASGGGSSFAQFRQMSAAIEAFLPAQPVGLKEMAQYSTGMEEVTNYVSAESPVVNSSAAAAPITPEALPKLEGAAKPGAAPQRAVPPQQSESDARTNEPRPGQAVESEPEVNLEAKPERVTSSLSTADKTESQDGDDGAEGPGPADVENEVEGGVHDIGLGMAYALLAISKSAPAAPAPPVAENVRRKKRSANKVVRRPWAEAGASQGVPNSAAKAKKRASPAPPKCAIAKKPAVKKPGSKPAAAAAAKRKPPSPKGSSKRQSRRPKRLDDTTAEFAPRFAAARAEEGSDAEVSAGQASPDGAEAGATLPPRMPKLARAAAKEKRAEDGDGPGRLSSFTCAGGSVASASCHLVRRRGAVGRIGMHAGRVSGAHRAVHSDCEQGVVCCWGIVPC